MRSGGVVLPSQLKQVGLAVLLSYDDFEGLTG